MGVIGRVRIAWLMRDDFDRISSISTASFCGSSKRTK
jgi:hypothetical protein